MTAKKTNELTTTEAPQLPAVAIDYGTDAGAGFDGVGNDEIGIPFLKTLQALSPEVVGPSGKMDGACPGLFLNTGTDELLESVTLVPAIRQHVFVEWRPRKQGGGIVAVYTPGEQVVLDAVADNARAREAGEPSRKPGGGPRRFGELYTPAGNDLVETFYVFCVVLEDDIPTGYIVVPFSSSQIKNYKKKFMNRVGNCMIPDSGGTPRRPPMFAHRIVLTTGDESNDDGVWKGYVIKFAVENNVKQSAMTPEHPGFVAGKELNALVTSGLATADIEKAGEAATDAGDTEESAF